MLYMPMKQGPFTLKRTIIEGDKRADIQAEFKHAEEGRLTTELEEVRADVLVMSLRIDYARRDKLGLWTDEGEILGMDEFECSDLAVLEEIAERWSGHHLNAGTSKQQALIRVTEQNRKAKLSYDERVELLKLNGAYEQEIPGWSEFYIEAPSDELLGKFSGWKRTIKGAYEALATEKWPSVPNRTNLKIKIKKLVLYVLARTYDSLVPGANNADGLAARIYEAWKPIKERPCVYRYGHGWLLEVLPVEVSSQVIQLMEEGEPTPTLEDANRQRWEELGLKFSFEKIPARTDRAATDWDKEARHFRCTLEREGREFVFEYSQGSGIKEKPDVLRVLESLQLDSRVGPEWDRGFEDWCENYGYDPDSRKAEGVYEACHNTRASMKRVLGGELFKAWMQEG